MTKFSPDELFPVEVVPRRSFPAPCMLSCEHRDGHHQSHGHHGHIASKEPLSTPRFSHMALHPGIEAWGCAAGTCHITRDQATVLGFGCTLGCTGVGCVEVCCIWVVCIGVCCLGATGLLQPRGCWRSLREERYVSKEIRLRRLQRISRCSSRHLSNVGVDWVAERPNFRHDIFHRKCLTRRPTKDAPP